MTDNESKILQMKLYYQDFHHKCISWYVTVIGFFLAGTIAFAPTEKDVHMLGYSIIGFSVLLSIVFFFCIFHFSARIDKLNSYLEPPNTVPNNWYTESKKVNIGIRGVGSWFFFLIIISMQSAVIGLVSLKFLC